MNLQTQGENESPGAADGSMAGLREFLVRHAERGTCHCGKCVDHPGEDRQPEGHTVDLVFFEVSAKDNPDAGLLRQLIQNNKRGEFCDLDPWDGKEHSYIEIGGWIGDQGMALSLMGLGAVLGLWKLMTPKMLGLDDAAAKRLAGLGMISILPETAWHNRTNGPTES